MKPVLNGKGTPEVTKTPGKPKPNAPRGTLGASGLSSVWISNFEKGTLEKTLPVDCLKKLGKAAFEARTEQQLTIGKLAEASGLSSVWISNFEKGTLENASLASLYAVAEPLKLRLTIHF